MKKHVYPSLVLVCTLSTYREGTERTLPDQASNVVVPLAGTRGVGLR